jgi:hypothetical protein
MPLTSIPKVRGSHLGSDARYSDSGFSWVSSVPPYKFWDRPRTLLSRSVLTHHPTYPQYMDLIMRASFAIIHGKHSNYSDAKIFQSGFSKLFKSSLSVFSSNKMSELQYVNENVIPSIKFELLDKELNYIPGDERVLPLAYENILLLPLTSVVIFIKLI